MNYNPLWRVSGECVCAQLPAPLFSVTVVHVSYFHFFHRFFLIFIKFCQVQACSALCCVLVGFYMMYYSLSIDYVHSSAFCFVSEASTRAICLFFVHFQRFSWYLLSSIAVEAFYFDFYFLLSCVRCKGTFSCTVAPPVSFLEWVLELFLAFAVRDFCHNCYVWRQFGFFIVDIMCNYDVLDVKQWLCAQ